VWDGTQAPGTWGDIIPPFTLDGVTNPGLNADTAGLAILANGCVPVVLVQKPTPLTSTTPAPVITPAITPPIAPVPPLATTGAGPVNAELTWAVALLTLGGLLAAAGTRRYRRTH